MIGSAKIMSAEQTIDEAKVTCSLIERALRISVELIGCVNLKDLFDSLSTCYALTDKSISKNVALTRYDFETHNVNRII